MKISKLISELDTIQAEYGDKDIVIVQYGDYVGGDYAYGHLVNTSAREEEPKLMASLTDLTNEIELYTTEE